jgi:hypothetical protein
MREDPIRQRLYPLELVTGAVLTVHAYSRGTVGLAPLSCHAVHAAC